MRFVDDNSMILDDKPTAKDIPNVRLIHTKFGETIRLERRDPHGFVYIVWYKGATPDVISGSFTDFVKARQALEIYLNSETFNKIVDTPVDKPVFKYKTQPAVKEVAA